VSRLAFRLAALAALAAASPARAQAADSTAGTGSVVARPDSTVAPATPLGIRVAPPAEGGLEAPVEYTARDSVRIVLAPRVRTGSAPAGARADDRVTLHGDATATYQTATIRAARLDYLAGPEELRAAPVESDTGAVGLPTFADGEESFTGRLFVYNLRTRRGRVTAARTRIDDGFLLGGVVVQRDEHVIFAQDAAYTTCDLDHPHYALEADRLKVVDGRRVFSGPVRLRLLGLPTPLWLPFGYFPAAEGRRSGPLPVRYGRESGFGLFLDNLGWYWAASEFFDLQLAGKVGTEGSFTATGTARYARRYRYTGDLLLSYGRLRQGESTDPGFAPRVPVRLGWNHRQTFAAGQTLSARVDLQSTSQRFATATVSQQIQTSTTSSVAFAQSWPRVGRALSVNAQAFQDLATGRATITLPTLTLTQQRRFPLRRGADDRWTDRLAVSYSATGTNTYDFTPLSDSTGVSFLDGLFSPSDFLRATGRDQRFDTRLVQTVPVQASFSAGRYNLSVVPSATWTETWLGRREQRTWLPDSARVLTEQVPGFTAVRRLAATVTASTELFGTFPLRVGPLDGLRHTVRPRASLSFEPDYASLGFVREVQADTTGRTVRYAIAPGVPLDPTRALSFGIENAVLVRVARPDSTGEIQRRTVQVLSFDLSGGVNFAAPVRPVRDLALTASSALGGLNASGQAGFSIYSVDSTGVLTETTQWRDAGRPLRLTGVSVRAGRSFSFGGAGAAETPVVAPLPAVRPGEPDYDPARPLGPSAVVGYTDATAPLSLTVDLTLSHAPARGLTLPAQTTATLSVTQFALRLTPAWRATGSTGLDLTNGRPTQTTIGLTRDLHCWELSINWQPIGFVRGFGVSLAVKSGYLRDVLRLDAPQTTVRPLPF